MPQTRLITMISYSLWDITITYVHAYIRMYVYIYTHIYIGDQLWENLQLTQKDKYLEIRNLIIQNVIFWEGLKLHAYNSLQIYSYLIAIRLPTPQCTASCFSRHFRLFFINNTSSHMRVEGWGWWVAMMWRVTAKLSKVKLCAIIWLLLVQLFFNCTQIHAITYTNNILYYLVVKMIIYVVMPLLQK